MKNYLFHSNLLFNYYKFLLFKKQFIVILLFIVPTLALAQTKNASLQCGLSLDHTDVFCAGDATGSITVNLATNEIGVFILNWSSTPIPVTSSSYTVASSDMDPVTGLFQGDILTVLGLVAGVYTLQLTTPNGSTCLAQATVFATNSANPVITCPTDIYVASDPGLCQVTVDIPMPVTDSCSVPQGPSQVTLSVGMSETIVYTATDANGNTASCSFSVNVVDVEPPIINCPSSISATITDGACGKSVTWGVVVSDNCGVSSVNNTCIYPDGDGSEIPCSSGDEYPIGTTIIINSATDNSGNTTNCIFQISVNDATPNNLFFTGNIPDGIYYANQDIISNGNVPNGEDVHFKAGQCVQLNGGFTVQPGASFSGEIEDCN